MFKKILIGFNLFLLSYATAWANECDKRAVRLEGTVAAYLPTSHSFQKIYGHVSGLYGAELTVQLYKDLHLFTGVNFFTQSGHSLGEHIKTKAFFVPTEIGLKYLHEFNMLDLYAGFGILFTYLHTHDYSPYVIPIRSKFGIGDVFKFGINIKPVKSFFIDLFANYYMMSTKFHSRTNPEIQGRKADFSGVALGAGFGFKF